MNNTDNKIICPICGNSAISLGTRDYRNINIVSCRSCNKYEITDGIKQKLESGNLNDVKYIIAGFLSENFERKEKLLISADKIETDNASNITIDQIVRERANPPKDPKEQLNRLLLKINSDSDEIGKEILYFLPLEYPSVYAKSKNEFKELLNILEQKELITITSDDKNWGIKLKLLAEGYVQIERLQNKKLNSIEMKQKPLVFISYASDELYLADFVKEVLLRISDNKADVFVAKRDISSGADPLKTMLNEKLKNADAIIPICSFQSKKSPWLWWESATVWGITGKVHPLFTDISAGSFGAPLNLVVQGKEFYSPEEFFETLETLCKSIGVTPKNLFFTSSESSRYENFKPVASASALPAHVKIGYKILEQTQSYHKYSLKFEIQNKSSAVFDDVVLDLFFPTQYLVKKDWDYPHLKSSIPPDDPAYTCLTFIFNNMPEKAKQEFNQFLLPEKTLKIFGCEPRRITDLEYEMDKTRWMEKHKFKVRYNLYINRKTPQKDSIEFSTLQYF